MSENATERCPLCGAALPTGESCEDVFYRLQGLEVQDPAYYAVHLLSVATYFIQHDRYSDEALGWIQGTMREFLGGKSAEAIRRAAKQHTDQANRTWKVLKPADAPPRPLVAWELTIAEVDKQTDAASYCALVTEWARATLQQMEGGWPGSQG